MLLDTRQIPDEGFLLEGEEKAEIFDLHEEYLCAASPLRYHLLATMQGPELQLQGSLEASFDLLCVRCLEPFHKTIRLDPYHHAEEVEKQGIVDLTNQFREDILLDLPDHPKCEQADSPRECPALTRIAPDSDYKPAEVTESDKDVWKALDNLKPDLNKDS